MKQTRVVIATKSSYSIVDCGSEIKQLDKDKKQLEKEFTSFSISQYLSDENNNKKKKLENRLEDVRRKLCTLHNMIKYKPQQWVYNQTTDMLGQILGHYINDEGEYRTKIKCGVVDLFERAAHLKIATSDYKDWIWTGQNHQKYIRKGDRKECDCLDTIFKEYESCLRIRQTHIDCDAPKENIESWRQKAVYLKKRYLKILRDNFPPETKIQVVDSGEVGTVQPYPTRLFANLPKVEIKLDSGSTMARSHSEIKIFQESKSESVRISHEGEEALPSVSSKSAKILQFCSRKPEIKIIAIADIRRNGGTQQRVGLNHETVKEYAEAMREGDKFPPVKVMFDGSDYWLTDGFHTSEAAWSIGCTEIEAEITEGTQREAILASVGVNTNHGLRRSNSDKRKAVRTLLEDEEWKQWSNREIAKRCKVSHSMVNKIRENLTGKVSSDNRKKYIDRYGKESTMQTQNIGNQDSRTVNLDSNCPDKESTVSISCPDKQNNDNSQPINDSNFPLHPNAKQLEIPERQLTTGFEVGQVVQIKTTSDRPDKRLVGFNKSFATITAINASTVNLKIYGDRFDAVSINDLEIVDNEALPSLVICINTSLSDYAKALVMFDSKEDIIKAAIAARSLGV